MPEKTMRRRQGKRPSAMTSGRIKCGLCLLAGLVLLVAIVVLVVYFAVQPRGAKAGPRAELVLPVLGAKWVAKCSAVDRHDCYPEPGVNRTKCVARGCCWLQPVQANASAKSKPKPPVDNAPVCVYPQNYGYVVSGREKQFLDGWEMPLARINSPPRYGNEFPQIHVRVEMQTRTRLRIKFYRKVEGYEDDQEPRIPVEKAQRLQQPRKTNLYAVSYQRTSIPFGLQVRRVDTGTIIFNTLASGFTFGNQFVQLTTKVASKNIYGLGPAIPTSPGQSNTWHTWSLFTGNFIDSKFTKSHGGHPMYMCLEKGGKAHAVLLHSTYPMDMTLDPKLALTYRVLGGSLDFYIFLGPTPEEVVQQYTEAVGRPFLPPYWTLGFQISHIGATNIQAIKDSLRDVGKNNVSYDVVALGGHYTNNGLDFTVDHKKFLNLLVFIEAMARDKRHIDINVDPALSTEQPAGSYPSYDEGLRLGLFVNDSFGKLPLVGMTRSGKSAFVDFLNPNTIRWWTRHLERLRSIVRYHTLTLVDNYPSNWANGSAKGCLVDNFNNPPYVLRALQKHKLFWNTLCLDSWQSRGKKKDRHYSLHNQYGHNMIKATHKALSSILSTERRVSLVSQSTFIGSGKFSGFWATNNTRSWSHLNQSINVMLSYNLYGIPLVGSAICGTDVYAEEEELCMRWIQLGAFYPLSRMPYDPIFCERKFGRIAKNAMDTRYSLLPYLYTLFFKVATEGGTVARPLFHEFPSDNYTYNINNQFMWGPSLMIAPALQKLQRLADVYLPKGYWYFYYTGGRMLSKGEKITMEAPLDRIILLIRGGHIIPTQPAELTTFQSRKNKMHLVVALNEMGSARGFLYWDDGMKRDNHLNKEYILANFSVAQNKLTISGKKMKPILPATVTSAYFTSVDIMGLPDKPVIAAISGTVGVLTKDQFIWDGRGKVLQLRKIIIPLTETVEIEWRWAK